MSQAMSLKPASGYTNKAVSSAGGATTLTYAAPGAGLRHLFGGGVFFGFATDPAAACFFTISVDGTETHRVPVTAGGAGFFPFSAPACGDTGKSVVFALTGDGGTAVGYISVCQHGIESVC